jgi:hypothetical protein
VATGFRKRSCSNKEVERDDDSTKSHRAPALEEARLWLQDAPTKSNIVISGIVVAIALGVVSAFALRGSQEPAYEAYSTSSTRVGDPGYNLVGKNWSGEPKLQRNKS